MFFLIPWRVDVPQERWPVMNWLILLALVGVFALQVRDRIRYEIQRDEHSRHVQPGAAQPSPKGLSAEHRPEEMPEVPDITRDWMLRSWSLKGLFGYMWLHGGLFHLLGNMLFLWIFGNAVCAKLGNLRYLGLYVLFGVVAGIAQLVPHALPVLGASGAINGVVGAYLVLFFENEITCLLGILIYFRWFTVSSLWIILLWLFWDVLGALRGGSHVGHLAHLGGFATGFGITLLMCKKGWITMEKYEKSLLQMWEARKRGRETEPLDVAYARLGLQMTDEERVQEVSTPAEIPTHEHRPIPLPPVESEPAPGRPKANGFIRTACACGQTIRVTHQYAGRAVRCPRCRQPVVIPAQTDFFGPAPPVRDDVTGVLKKPQDNFIRFACTCGKRIKAPAQYAGHSAKCPRCGIRLKIPAIGP